MRAWISDEETARQLRTIRTGTCPTPIQEWGPHCIGFGDIGFDNIEPETRHGVPGWIVRTIDES